MRISTQLENLPQLNTYLKKRGVHNGASNYFRIVLNNAIDPDQTYNLQQIQIPGLGEELKLDNEDIKIMALAASISNEKKNKDHSQNEAIESNPEQKQRVALENILSKASADATNISKATTVINDEAQKNWNTPIVDIDLKDTSTGNEAITQNICRYYDGEESRTCETTIESGKTRCAIHNAVYHKQPMQMLKNMQEIEPGRAFSIMKNIIMEAPNEKRNIQATYANSYNGDTKAFMNSFTKLRKLMEISFQAFPGLDEPDTFKTFNAQPFIQEFQEVNFSEVKWFAVYQSVKEALKAKNLHLNMPWINYAYMLAEKQGRVQGYINMDRNEDRMMAREDRVIRWEQPYSQSFLDPAIFRPEALEKAPALYLTNNKYKLHSYLNHQTDGHQSQTGKYEKGFLQSENSQPIFGIFHDQRPLMYENPNSETVITKKALVMIQVEMETAPLIHKDVGRFHDRLNMTASDKIERIKVQLKSIEAQIDDDIKSFKDLNSLAREINEPNLKHEELEKMLRKVLHSRKNMNQTNIYKTHKKTIGWDRTNRTWIYRPLTISRLCKNN